MALMNESGIFDPGNLYTGTCPKCTISDVSIIRDYCDSYIHSLPYSSLAIIFTLTLICIILYSRQHPNFIGFAKMTAFVTILLSLINLFMLLLALS